jgi:hypothetical protein
MKKKAVSGEKQPFGNQCQLDKNIRFNFSLMIRYLVDNNAKMKKHTFRGNA